MKICFITFEYPPFITGGAGVYALHITRELAKLGHEVHVISGSVKGRGAYSMENDVFIHRIPVIHKRLLYTPSFWLNLAKKYSKIRKDFGRFNILHDNDISAFSLSKWQIKESRVVTIHHLSCLLAQNTPPLKRFRDISSEIALIPLFQKIIISRADKIIAVSKFTKETLISSHSMCQSKIDVVLNGINSDEYFLSENEVLKFKKSIGLTNCISFLFVGRMNDPRKNLQLLLKAFAIMCKNIKKSIKLILVGSGDYIKVNKIVDALGIKENIIIMGYVDDGTLKKCYNVCDIYVSPSMLEGFGLTILEAMAAGKPIIAFNVGAIPEIVKDGLNGMILDRQNPNELANAMSFFAGNLGLAKKIGNENRKYVSEKFSWNKAARMIEQVYQKLLYSSASAI